MSNTITETNYLERIVLAFNGDTDGSFKAAAAERFNVMYRDGKEIFRQPGKGVTITELAADGFKWTDIVPEINAGLILTVERQAEQIAALQAAKEKADQALAAVTSERDAAIAKVAELQSQIDAAAPPTVNDVPQSITKKQGRAQLKAEGLLAAVEGYIASLPADDDTRMAYEDAGVWVRTDPSVLGMMALLKKTNADADAFFVAAAQR